jgi:acyl carrier protein
MTSQEIETEFWRLFGRVLGRRIEPGRYATADLPEWDSLRHVELVFELEERFRVDVPQDRIAELFSDTDAVLAFLRARGAER